MPPPDAARAGSGNLGVTGTAAPARTKGAARILITTQRDAPALYAAGAPGCNPVPMQP
jgi:hypothetical protein